MTWTLPLILLVFAAAARPQVRPSERCYPGLDCSFLAAASPSDTLISLPVAGFRFTQTFVLDGEQGLLWSRDLYAVGDTVNAFKEAYGGNESMSSAYDKVRARASGARIGGVAGWRLATRSELDHLLARLAPATIYAYFRARSVQLPSRSVLGTYDAAGGPENQVPVDGMLYENTAIGRPRGYLGSPERNRFGLWLVRALSPDIDQAQTPVAEPLRQYYEPIEEQWLKPVNVYQVVKREESYERSGSAPSAAMVSTTLALNSRFFARYNLKPLPRGTLVTAEVVMRGRSSSGSPASTVTVQINPASIDTSRSLNDLWTFAGGSRVGTWQMPGAAKLELPEHIMRNVFNANESFYLSFSADFNACEFEIPDVIVRYVLERNVLHSRPLP